MSTTLPAIMPAIRKTKDAPGLEFCPETEVPTIGPNDVLVKVTHAGICGTDRHIYEWDEWSQNRVKVGITTGHEFVGIVTQVGSAVNRVEVGQRVSAEGHVGCGHCQQCRTGNAHICDHVDILGIDRNGCFAHFISVPQENIWPVNPSIPNRFAAIFDPFGNAVHTVMAGDVSNKSVLITGVGIIGLMAVAVARAAGAWRIIVTDVDKRRLNLAMELGADEALSATDPDLVRQIRDASGATGPDVLLEMSGHPGALIQGLDALQNGGTAALLGIPSNEISIDLSRTIIFKGAKVLGINGRMMFETWYQMERFLLAGIDLDPIVTHEIPMDQFESGFQKMQSGEAIKVVLEM